MENYHTSAVFRLMKDEGCDVISNLRKEEYKYVDAPDHGRFFCTDTDIIGALLGGYL